MAEGDDQQTLLDIQQNKVYVDLCFDGAKMKLLRWFLSVTCQWLPKDKDQRPTWKLLLVYSMEMLYGIIVLAYIPYIMGLFPPPTLAKLDLAYPITTIKNTIWNLRWALSYFLGLHFFKTRVLEDTLLKVKISEGRWKSVKLWVGMFHLVAFILVLLIPLLLKCYEMTIELSVTLPNGHTAIFYKSASWYWIGMFAGLFLLNRFLTLPLFSAIITLAFILGMQIRQFKDRLLQWDNDSGLNSAKSAFTNEVKLLLRSFQTNARWYLSMHLFLLLVFSFLSVASCFERIYIGVPKNFTYYEDQNNNLILKPISIDSQSVSRPYVENLKHESTSKTDINPNQNLTQMPFSNAMSTKNIQKIIKEDIRRVIASEFLDFSESFILYCLPFFLLARIGDLLEDLRHGVQDANHEEQIQNGHIFTEYKKVKEMKLHIESAQGLQVMGINMSFFKAILLTLFGPLLTSLMHLMLKYIHFYN